MAPLTFLRETLHVTDSTDRSDLVEEDDEVDEEEDERREDRPIMMVLIGIVQYSIWYDLCVNFDTLLARPDIRRKSEIVNDDRILCRPKEDGGDSTRRLGQKSSLRL